MNQNLSKLNILMLQPAPTDCAAGCQMEGGYLMDPSSNKYENLCTEIKDSGNLLSRAGMHITHTVGVMRNETLVFVILEVSFGFRN